MPTSVPGSSHARSTGSPSTPRAVAGAEVDQLEPPVPGHAPRRGSATRSGPRSTRSLRGIAADRAAARPSSCTACVSSTGSSREAIRVSAPAMKRISSPSIEIASPLASGRSSPRRRSPFSVGPVARAEVGHHEAAARRRGTTRAWRRDARSPLSTTSLASSRARSLRRPRRRRSGGRRGAATRAAGPPGGASICPPSPCAGTARDLSPGARRC